jgi:RIO kinase 2
MKLDPELI